MNDATGQHGNATVAVPSEAETRRARRIESMLARLIAQDLTSMGYEARIRHSRRVERLERASAQARSRLAAFAIAPQESVSADC